MVALMIPMVLKKGSDKDLFSDRYFFFFMSMISLMWQFGIDGLLLTSPRLSLTKIHAACGLKRISQ